MKNFVAASAAVSVGEGELALESLRSSDRDPEQQTLDREARAFLEAAVDKLPDNFRAVFVTREIEGMNTAETAECLEITEENVKTRLFRAREIMRGELFFARGGRELQRVRISGRTL
ncbi:MAG: sigma-70 family RNA polymerase sigma factor [Acidobacteriota bacterium]|nr:sigma-70 family RNA polymerase sigma factor [Acidobacteriota bacterium]